MDARCDRHHGVGDLNQLMKGYSDVKDLKTRFVTGLVLVFSCCVYGCSGDSDAPVENLVSGSGTIKLDGEPAANVRIRLTPINETISVGGAWAVTNDDGTFKLTHWTDEEGIGPGSYLISFSRLLKPDGTPLGDNDSPALVQARETIANAWSNPEPDQMSASMRRVDIPESGKADIDFMITAAE